MDYFPIFLRLANEPVLVVGGGAVAERKIDLLLRTSAQVRVVAPELVPALAQRAAAGEIVHLATEFRPEHLEGVRLAIAARARLNFPAEPPGQWRPSARTQRPWSQPQR